MASVGIRIICSLSDKLSCKSSISRSNARFEGSLKQRQSCCTGKTGQIWINSGGVISQPVLTQYQVYVGRVQDNGECTELHPFDVNCDIGTEQGGSTLAPRAAYTDL